MEEITLESIRAKLGFDPLNPPEREVEPYAVDDHTPSMWGPLTKEEQAFLLRIQLGSVFENYEESISKG